MNTADYNKLSKEEQKKVPFKQLPKPIKFIVFAFVAVIIAIFIGIATSDPSDRKVTPEICYVIAQTFVKNSLKCPSTADFPSLEYKYVQTDSITHVIRSYVDSQNSFGAMIRTNYIISLQFNGGDCADISNWRVKDIMME